MTRLFAQSRTIQARLERWGGIASTVVYPPPPPRPYRCDTYGDFVLVVSRLTPLKRVGLVIDALAQPDAAGVKCVVVGDGEEEAALRRAVDERGMGDRVSFLGAVGDDVLLTQLATCRAVCFPAAHEDFGLVTVEAFASGKAVITCHDSGGPAELVEDGTSGLVTTPDAPSLARALASVEGDQALAERLGAGALQRVAELTWERTFEQLLLV